MRLYWQTLMTSPTIPIAPLGSEVRQSVSVLSTSLDCHSIDTVPNLHMTCNWLAAIKHTKGSNTQVTKPKVDCNNHNTKWSHCSITTHKYCQLAPKQQPTSDPTNLESSYHLKKCHKPQVSAPKVFHNYTRQSDQTKSRVISQKKLLCKVQTTR